MPSIKLKLMSGFHGNYFLGRLSTNSLLSRILTVLKHFDVLWALSQIQLIQRQSIPGQKRLHKITHLR